MDIQSHDIPHHWAVCFLSQCSQKHECLRHKAAQALPPDQLVSTAVLPSALSADGCPLFRPIEPLRVAVGFKGIFSEVKERDAKALRSAIRHYLGSLGSYYRHLNGTKPLLPEQQAWIEQLFERYGYATPLTFDAYREEYRFD